MIKDIIQKITNLFSSESRGVVPGMNFYLFIIYKELKKVEENTDKLVSEYKLKRFKTEEGKKRAFEKALFDRIINVPIILKFNEPHEAFPIHQLTITFSDIRGVRESDKDIILRGKGASAVYKNKQTVFTESGEIESAIIGLKLNFNFDNALLDTLNIVDLVYSKTSHELTHLYQHYKWNNKNDYNKNRQLLKNEFTELARRNRDVIEDSTFDPNVRKRHENMEYLNYFFKKGIYYLSDKEIAAKVNQIYYELKAKETTIETFLDKLDDITHWKNLKNYYFFNIDIMRDLILEGHTVVIVDKNVKSKIKIRYSEIDLSQLLRDLDDAIPDNKRKEIEKKYNLKYYYDNPRDFFKKLLDDMEIQAEKFRRKILKLRVNYMTDAQLKATKPKKKKKSYKIIPTKEDVDNNIVVEEPSFEDRRPMLRLLT